MNDRPYFRHGPFWWGTLGVSEGDETGCRRIHWKPFALILLGEDLYLREGIGCHERVQI